jgi:hypothetical protein
LLPNESCKKSGQQTPRRWGWGTPLKKRAAARMNSMWRFSDILSTSYRRRSLQGPA